MPICTTRLVAPWAWWFLAQSDHLVYIHHYQVRIVRFGWLFGKLQKRGGFLLFLFYCATRLNSSTFGVCFEEIVKLAVLLALSCLPRTINASIYLEVLGCIAYDTHMWPILLKDVTLAAFKLVSSRLVCTCGASKQVSRFDTNLTVKSRLILRKVIQKRNKYSIWGFLKKIKIIKKCKKT